MCDFIDKEDLELSIDRLSEREKPCAIRLGQQPGQRGERIAHLFAGKPVVQATAVDSSAHSTTTSGNTAQSHEESDETVQLLEMEVGALKEQVSSLSAETSALKMQLNALYELTGNSKQD